MANSKYTREQWIALYDSTEPVFALRAKDDLSVMTVGFYGEKLIQVMATTEPDPIRKAKLIASMTRIFQTVMEFVNWRTENKDKCKLPD